MTTKCVDKQIEEYSRAQMNSGFYYSNILYSQLPNILFDISMDEISIIQLYKMSF